MRRLYRASLIAALPLLFFIPAAHAVTGVDTWTGGTGSWFTAGNWSAGVPTSATIAGVDNGNTTASSSVTISGDAVARLLNIDAGDQLTMGDVVADAPSTLTTEVLTNNGVINANAGNTDTITVTGPFTNNGTIRAYDGNILVLNSSHFGNSAVVNNGLIEAYLGNSSVGIVRFNTNEPTVPMNITGSGNISVHDGGTIDFAGPVNINSTGYINDSGGPASIIIDGASNVTIAGLTGTSNFSSTPVSTLTLNTPSSVTCSYSGALQSNVTIVKQGAGTEIFAGQNTYTGTTDITAGTLEVDGQAGTGNLTVHANSTLAGNGNLHCFAIVNSGGTLSPGTSAGADAGTFTAEITLLLNAGSTLRMDVSNEASQTDFIRVQNGEFEAENVGIQLVPHGSLSYHSTISLMQWSNTLTFDPLSFHLLPGAGVNGTLSVEGNVLDFYVLADAGDANEDGKVDLDDLNIVLNHLGQTTSAWTDGNFDGAASIDLNDLNDVLNHLGVSSTNSSNVLSAEPLAPATTPEPTTLAILGAVLLLPHRRPR